MWWCLREIFHSTHRERKPRDTFNSLLKDVGTEYNLVILYSVWGKEQQENKARKKPGIFSMYFICHKCFSHTVLFLRHWGSSLMKKGTWFLSLHSSHVLHVLETSEHYGLVFSTRNALPFCFPGLIPIQPSRLRAVLTSSSHPGEGGCLSPVCPHSCLGYVVQRGHSSREVVTEGQGGISFTSHWAQVWCAFTSRERHLF